MTCTIGITSAKQKIDVLESLFQEMSLHSTPLESIEAKILETISPYFANRDAVNEIQNRVHGIVARYLYNTTLPLSSKINESLCKHLRILFELQFVQLPDELIVSTLLKLPFEELLKLRPASHQLRDIIDTSPELQSHISHQKLKAMQSKCNIPMEDMKFDYSNEKLSLEVNNNICLWKLTRTQLNQPLPWISHLIIKNGKPKELLELFKQLQENKRLMTLYLLNCEVDVDALNALKQLQISSPFNQKTPYFYFCNLKASNCELPSSGSHLFIIDPHKAHEYSIERFITKESDRIALQELSKQVENTASSSDLIVENLESLNSVLKAGIIASIWYSAVMPANDIGSPILKKEAHHAVSTFISMHPHHPAISAALSQALLY